MLKIRVNGEKHYVKNLFSDCTLKDLEEAFILIDQQPKAVKDHILRGKEIEKKDLLEFMIDYVLIFSDLKREHLENIAIDEGPLDLSLVKLYELTRPFMYYPKDILEIREFKHHGKTFRLLEPLRTVKGVELFFGNASYKQFKLMSQLATEIDKNKTQGAVDSLRQLLAIIYTNGNDSDQAITERYHSFKDLDLLTAYSGWFFFAMVLTKYRNFFLLSSDQAQVKMEVLKLEEKVKRFISRGFIGRYLKTRWLNWEYLILKDERQSKAYKKQALLMF